MKFKIDHDLHLHSSLSLCSGDPSQTPAALLEYAVKSGFSAIAITDHFWDERIPGSSSWYSKQDFAHISEALPLPKVGGVRYYFGCEAEMKKDFELCITRERIDSLDFVIIPTNHLHMTDYTCDKADVSLSKRAELLMSRTRALFEMDLPFYKMGLAHFTDPLLAYYSEATRDEVLSSISDAAYRELFSLAARVGIGIELNVSLEDAKNEEVLRPYKIAKSVGCKFYLGSDAHTARALGAAMPRFEAIVDALSLSEDDKIDFLKK